MQQIDSASVYKSPGGNKVLLVILLVVIVIQLIIIGAGGYYFLNQKKEQQIDPKGAQNQEPVSRADPNLLEYGKYYSFKTRILQLNEFPDSLLLKVDNKNKYLSEVNLTRDTLVNYLVPGINQMVKVSFRLLEPGQDIIAMVTLNESNNKWVTRNVIILTELPKEKLSTSSAKNTR